MLGKTVMDEAQWMTSEATAEMLGYLLRRNEVGTIAGERMGYRTSERKLRLFACALWRLALSRAGKVREPAMWEARERLTLSVRSAELWADGKPTQPDNGYAVLEEMAAKAADDTVRAPSICRLVLPPEQATILREIVGNPWQPHSRGQPWLGIAATAALSPAITSIARTAYEECDWGLLPILADALEEVGCQEETLLRHLRGYEVCPDCMLPTPAEAEFGGGIYWCPGCGGTESGNPDAFWKKSNRPHCRGCWATDCVLGKK